MPESSILQERHLKAYTRRRGCDISGCRCTYQNPMMSLLTISAGHTGWAASRLVRLRAEVGLRASADGDAVSFAAVICYSPLKMHLGHHAKMEVPPLWLTVLPAERRVLGAARAGMIRAGYCRREKVKGGSIGGPLLEGSCLRPFSLPHTQVLRDATGYPAPSAPRL